MKEASLASRVKLRFGIVTPSRARLRFLPAMARQVRDQSCQDWDWVYVHDGPSPAAARSLLRQAAGDPRIHYLEMEQPGEDWGWSPRVAGIRQLAKLPRPPEYVAMWDDDDAFHSDALESIRGELEKNNWPDLLLVPVRGGAGVLPVQNKSVADLGPGEVCTLNLIARLEIALTLLPQETEAEAGRGTRGEDYRYFDRVRARSDARIVLGSMPPIGSIDGLRRWMRLRWKLGIPPLNISDMWWWRGIRKALRQ